MGLQEHVVNEICSTIMIKIILHINNVNILLELIARYVIELLNPELKNVVERRTLFYKDKYKRLFEKEDK